MKYLINLLVIALIGFLAYTLWNSIQEPIKFKEELGKRQDVVTEKLTMIRSAQEIYRDIKGEFAGSFDELRNTLMTDSIPFTRVEADPNDPTNEALFKKFTTYSPAMDKVKEMGINLDDMASVPFSNSASFEMVADTTTYQSTLVPVMECMTRYKEFMGEYADPRFKKYDNDYNPEARLGFGSMSSPNLEGNWR